MNQTDGRKNCHRLPDGVGTNGFFAEGLQIPYSLPYFVVRAHMLPHFAQMLPHCATACPRFPVKVDYGGLRHFCDDPVCPEPVRKLSKQVFTEYILVYIYIYIYTYIGISIYLSLSIYIYIYTHIHIYIYITLR